MARQTELTILVVAMVLIQGCGAPAASPSPMITGQPSVVVASPTPAPTPSPDLGALVSDYSAIAAKTTAARAQCSTDVDAASANLASAKIAAQKCLDDFSAVSAGFKAVNWGPAQPQADRVIAAIDALDTIAGQMANAATVAAFRAAYDQLLPAAASLLSGSEALEAALGMPPN